MDIKHFVVIVIQIKPIKPIVIIVIIVDLKTIIHWIVVVQIVDKYLNVISIL